MKSKEIVKHLLSWILIIVMVVPFIYVIFGSTNDSGWFFNSSFKLTLGNQFKRNYFVLVNDYKLYKVIFNSIISSLLISSVSIIIIYLAAYSLSQYQFRYKRIIIILMITLLIIPMPAYLIGNLLVINKLKIHSTFLGLVLPYLVNIRILFYLMTSFKIIPKHIVESSKIDGADDVQILTKIVTPLMKDKIFLAFFIIFIVSWSNYLLPMLTTNDSKLFTLPILVSILADSSRYDLGIVFMTLLIIIIPVLLLFFTVRNKIFSDSYNLVN